MVLHTRNRTPFSLHCRGLRFLRSTAVGIEVLDNSSGCKLYLGLKNLFFYVFLSKFLDQEKLKRLFNTRGSRSFVYFVGELGISSLTVMC